MSGLASLEAARRLGIPLAHTYHALGVVKRRHQGARDTSPAARIEVEARLAREADLVVATTRAEITELERMGGDRRRMRVVPCGVDLTTFTPAGATAARTPGRRRIVVVSRLVERKGIGNVIAALAELPADVELVVVGGPPAALVTEDDEARRFLALAKRLGVAQRVELRGATTRERIPELIRSADVVACCPWYEPFGLVAVEAMACGVPVVATAVGGLAETVVDGVTGRLVRPRSPRAIATALSEVLADERHRRALGQGAVRRSQAYGWPDVARRTHEVLEALAMRARTPLSRRAAS
jgi:glycosyltransferase involved in cell wall biosynthesis